MDLATVGCNSEDHEREKEMMESPEGPRRDPGKAVTGVTRTTGSETWLSIEETVSHGIQGWQKQDRGRPLRVAGKRMWQERREETQGAIQEQQERGAVEKQ